jgi:hypothetical protein
LNRNGSRSIKLIIPLFQSSSWGEAPVSGIMPTLTDDHLMDREIHLAYFISSHGFGHGARAAAVMAAVHRIAPKVCFDLFTTVPSWFFSVSLAGPYEYHPCMSDVGLVQRGPLHEDLPETVSLLSSFLPFRGDVLKELGDAVRSLKCVIVICDISPLGVAVAGRLGIPSLLIENFTWDWIYEHYAAGAPQMKAFGAYLKDHFEQATYRIQTEPVCVPARADLVTPPVSRAFRMAPDEVRRQLGVAPDKRVVTVTMGGVAEEMEGLDTVKDAGNVLFVAPGGSRVARRTENLILLPRQAGLFHPDLIRASDVVVGKIGYSTLAEVYYAGVPFGYIARRAFRESEVLAAFVWKEMHSLEIQDRSFQDGSWTACVPDLLDLPRVERKGPLGSEAAARFIVDLIR